jgi:hypothetical protein
MSFGRVTPAPRFRDGTEIERRLKGLFSLRIRSELLKAAITLRTVGDNKRRRVASRLWRLNTVTSAHDLRFGGAGQAPNRHRYLRPLGLLLCVAGCLISRLSNASELALGRSAVQAIVASALFKDQGRWYLTKGDCYVYLENPKITFANGRLVMNAHLSSRVGLEVGGSCVGTGLASDVQLSGKFVGSGSQLTLQDIKTDNVADDATRQVLDLLQSAAGSSLPRAVNVDLMQLPGTDIKVSVTSVVIAGVVIEPQYVTVRFEAKLRAD